MNGIEPVELSLSMSNEWAMVIEYSADLFCPPDNQSISNLIVGSQVNLFNETNTVIEVQADSVTIREESSKKRTTIAPRQSPVRQPAPGMMPQQSGVAPPTRELGARPVPGTAVGVPAGVPAPGAATLPDKATP